MRGLHAIALLAALALGSAPAVWAQRHGSAPVGPGSAPMGPAMFPGPRAAMGNPGVATWSGRSSGGSHFQSGFHPGFHPGFRPGFDGHGRFHGRGNFAPWVPWGGYYYSPPDYEEQAQAEYEAEQAAARAQQEAAEDQQRRQALQQTIDDLRAYNEQRERELEQERLARESAPPQPPAPPEPAVILVFKDGHRAEVSNYAIMGDTFYDLSSGRPHKIPLTDLDLDATTRLNEENGVDFRLPGKRGPA
ncbi:MAG TPA: hypothetical protein VEG08_01375 [Terriglobales bacterium]|nr:hypothetical protein [Terriglobales bacterium]